jgi:folate-binding protein YgfZ
MSSTASSTADLRTGLGVIAGQRECVVVDGPQAFDFLQGQLSQDMAALAPGEAAFSLLLHPQGKISAWFRIARAADDRFVIDVDHGWADEVVGRLNRFKLRTDCTIEKMPWHSVTIVGPQADDVAVDGVEHDMVTSWAGVPVRDVFGPAVTPQSLRSDTAVEIDPAVFDSLRIEGGIPRMGSELDDTTIPAAAGIVEQSVSFTKGCYTGQELVARIDSRGNNVPRRLVGIVMSGHDVPIPGAEVTVDGAAVGSVTSSGRSEQLDAAVCLAYVARSADIGQPVAVGSNGGSLAGELRALPLVTA